MWLGRPTLGAFLLIFKQRNWVWVSQLQIEKLKDNPQ